jgi:hypothetical protein
MSDNYVIEIRPKSVGITVQAGIVVRDGHFYRFFAATEAFNSLEGRLFKSPRAAEHAALCRVTDGAAPKAASSRYPSRAIGLEGSVTFTKINQVEK